MACAFFTFKVVIGVTLSVTGNETSSKKDGSIGHILKKTIVQSCLKQVCQSKLSCLGGSGTGLAVLSLLFRDVISAARLWKCFPHGCHRDSRGQCMFKALLIVKGRKLVMETRHLLYAVTKQGGNFWKFLFVFINFLASDILIDSRINL